MYGAFWCSHCEDQKETFGAGADIPYVVGLWLGLGLGWGWVLSLGWGLVEFRVWIGLG